MSPSPEMSKNSAQFSSAGIWREIDENPVRRARTVASSCSAGVSRVCQIFPNSKTRKFLSMPPRWITSSESEGSTQSSGPVKILARLMVALSL